MKRIAFFTALVLMSPHLMAQDSANHAITKDSFYELAPVEVRAVRAADRAPVSKTNLSKKDIEKENLGQDLPFLLNQTPSVVADANAGNGVGYTNIRIRGTDASRINVTLNGIPYNDAESQGTFFVDLPDFASSVNSVQIERGVGSSSNGAGAFGATINFSTNETNPKAYAELNNSYGSFDTWKNTVKIGTGLLAKHFTFDMRASNVTSDGYVDRAFSKLKSFYFSAVYIGNKDILRFNLFKGYERTYQAWYGVTDEDLNDGRRRFNYAGTEKPGDPYPNETDNYWQDHYQLFYTHNFNTRLSFNTAIFFTKGKGYYEEYRAGQDYSEYNLPYPLINGDTIMTSDFIRQLWLNNNFYGNIFSFQYRYAKTEFTLGGAYTRYEGQHFGKLIWAEHGFNGPDTWYDVHAFKNDFDSYARLLQQLNGQWNAYVDLQYHHVKYDINGFDDNPSLIVGNDYDFFNPKIGLSFTGNGWNNYLSFGLAGKEPNRDDFEAGGNQQPQPEHLYDLELNLGKKSASYNWSATFYYMKYQDQLVLTGMINDVGAYTRTNVPKSYRAGVELQGTVRVTGWLNAAANLTVSRNKVIDFTEYLDDYDNGGQQVERYHLSDIALSPNVIGATTITLVPVHEVEIALLGKYVSKQYLDNTEHADRALKSYYVEDARASYSFQWRRLKEASLIFQLNNIFNKKYEPTGATYPYFSNGVAVADNYYFPMAGTNFMAAINLKF